MICHRIVLCLALLSASVGFAQASSDAPVAGASDPAPPPANPEMAVPPDTSGAEQAPAVAQPPPPEPAVPPGELIPYHYRPQDEDPPDLVLPRVLAEVFGGALGGVGMGIVGLLAGVSALENVDCAADHAGLCAATVLIVAVPATFVGVPLGVKMAAESLGGRGEFLPALAGTLLGTGAGLMYGLTEGGTGPVVTGLVVGPLLGAIVGYEISNALVRRGSLSASARSGPQVMPTVGATPRGGVFGGLTGRF